VRLVWHWVSLVPVAIRLCLGRVWSSGFVKRAVRKPMQTNPVVQAATGAVLAITLTGLFPLDELIRSAGSSIGTLLPGPSAAEKSVDSLYSELERSNLWRSPPSMSTESREALIDHWDNLRPDIPHEFSKDGAKEVELDDLFRDHALDGRRVAVRAYVSQLYAQIPVPDHEELLSASFRLGLAEKVEVAWCARANMPRDRMPRVDQLVEVAGVVVARGSADVADGGFVIGTYLLCSAVRPVGGARHAEEVAALFRGEEDSTAWANPPSLSSSARRFLTRAWGRLNPYEPHPYPRDDGMPIGIDHVFEDSRFDGRLLKVSGYVTQRFLYPAENGLTLQYIRLQSPDQDDAVWCRTTVQSWRVFDEGELVEAVGVPFARGSGELEDGGLGSKTAFVCPAMRRG
jgi:hypothetical protein